MQCDIVLTAHTSIHSARTAGRIGNTATHSTSSIASIIKWYRAHANHVKYLSMPVSNPTNALLLQNAQKVNILLQQYTRIPKPRPHYKRQLKSLAPLAIAAIQTRPVAEQTLSVGVAGRANGLPPDDGVIPVEVVLLAQGRAGLNGVVAHLAGRRGAGAHWAGAGDLPLRRLLLRGAEVRAAGAGGGGG